MIAESKAAEEKKEEDEGKEKEKEGLSIIRFDLCLAGTVPYDAPKELWMDHAIVQETAQSYQAEMITHLEGGERDESLPCLPKDREDEREEIPLPAPNCEAPHASSSPRLPTLLPQPCHLLSWLP